MTIGAYINSFFQFFIENINNKKPRHRIPVEETDNIIPKEKNPINQ